MSGMRANPKKLNPLQLKTLVILQAMAAEKTLADPPAADGTVRIHSLPHAHGDHFHIGSVVVRAQHATGFANPNVMNALTRKGLLRADERGPLVLTAEGRAYDTGMGPEILHEAQH